MILRILTALLLSCSVTMAGQGMGPGPGCKGYVVAGGCSGCTLEVSDGFTNRSAFTADAAVWGGTDQLYNTEGWTIGFLRYSTAVGDECQWARLQITDTETITGTDYGGGVALRMTGATGYRYVVMYQPNSTTPTLQWQIYNGATYSSTVQSQTITALADGDHIAARVSGTGTDTKVELWVNPSGSPACPDNFGTATYTMENNPGNAADTGEYIGVFDYHGSVTSIYDNFSGGGN